ncbi:MAG: D-alanyl-D-alanine carboxypeptidase/D-alanyl-D-alanine-endopeptidase [Desulfomonile tiedjei]|uniref:D-alanyl-D-alanine carboxypeptidase/D-alanyl-D-alanine-endopeptidase n=1 Tax=Desulfomonile tiedjei TaxID=2358 RepID=A0A9D6Z2E8_9BACT|nr:D-alanyl-D-alanine carboxypeptidase/D-alanyl-D-alanine-endopeptidase [Desulfomonile tiedjei]
MLRLNLRIFSYRLHNHCAAVFRNVHVVVLSLFMVVVTANAVFSSGAAFNNQLETIVGRELAPDFAITIQVADLQTGRVLMEKNPDLPLVPASTMKIATSAAALSVLKPDFVFVTEVLADQAKDSSVGNLYVKGYGDPYLVSEELFTLARSVRERGLKEVRGNIVVDDSYFAPDPPLDENEKIGTRAYHAPYGALSLNFNSVKVLVRPANRSGNPADVTLDPISEYADVKAAVMTTKGNKPAQFDVTKEATPGKTEIIQLEGTIGVNAPSKSRYVNVNIPSLYTGEVFREFLLREGIKIKGRVIQGKVSPNAISYVEYGNSRALSAMIYGLNKFSNNFMAEQISLALGANVFGPPGTREKGLSVIRKHLLSCGVPENSFSLSEASGLSRNNRVSASALVRVLSGAAKDFTYNSEFMSSFGVAGVDGTLKEKFTDSTVRRRIRAKTGNLRGVNALAGYALAQDGRVLVFAAIVNSNNKGAGFIDYGEKIVRAVMDTNFGTRSNEVSGN